MTTDYCLSPRRPISLVVHNPVKGRSYPRINGRGKFARFRINDRVKLARFRINGRATTSAALLPQGNTRGSCSYPVIKTCSWGGIPVDKRTERTLRGTTMKSLSERIGERARISSSRTPQANRAIVLALRVDIQVALDDGWSVLAIYRTLYDEGKVSFSYQAFRRHVNRIFFRSLQARRGCVPTTTAARNSPRRNTGTGFSFNSNPDEDELF